MESTLTISYFLDWKFSPNTGVPKKVEDQIREWGNQGCKVTLIIVTPEKFQTEWLKRFPNSTIFNYKNFFWRFVARKKALNIMRKQKDSIIYIRFGILIPSQIFMMLRKKTILELNFKGLAEYRKRSLFLAIYIFIVRYFVFNFCLGACAVTEEISEEFQSFVKAKNSVKTFPNSINLEKYSTLPQNNVDGIRMVFVGSPGQSWHGVDRIISLARFIPEFEFHIVGPIYESDNLNDQPKNVFFYGEIYDMKLDEIMAKMDIGISSLGMERIGLTEASPLKTRQYLALGLPVISGIRDSAIQSSEDFYLFLTENDLQFHEEALMKIRSFAASWKGRRVTKDRLSIINSAKIEKDRIEFVNYLLGNK